MSITLIGKHEKDSRANRDGYVEAMLEMMAENDKLVHIDCDLMGCINTGKLLKAYPERTFNAGIAEQNAMGVAAGMGGDRPDRIRTFVRLLCLPPYVRPGIPVRGLFRAAGTRDRLGPGALRRRSTARPICRLRTARCT